MPAPVSATTTLPTAHDRVEADDDADGSGVDDPAAADQPDGGGVDEQEGADAPEQPGGQAEEVVEGRCGQEVGRAVEAGDDGIEPEGETEQAVRLGV